MALAPHSRPASPSPFARTSPTTAASFPSFPRPSSRLEHRRYTISPSTASLSNLVLGPPRLSPSSSSSSTLLPSFGRFLPPPHPALSPESPDPRCHSSSNSLGWASLRATATTAPSSAPLGKRIGGGKSGARAPSTARTAAGVLPKQQHVRRTSSPGPIAPQWSEPPAHDPSRQSALPLPRSSIVLPARAPSPIRRSRSFHTTQQQQQAPSRHSTSSSSSSNPSSSSSRTDPARPSSLVVPADARASLRRTHSKVELDSPGPESIPPSPTASAHLSPAERHRTVRSNAPGFRSLVRRGSLTAFDLRVYDDDEAEGGVDKVRARATLRPPVSLPPAPMAPTHRRSDLLQRRPSSPSSSTRTTTPLPVVATSPPPRKPLDFPPDDPRIPPQRRSSSSAGADDSHGAGAGPGSGKRTIFNPYELSVLQALWARGMFYPAPEAIDEVVRRTGMTRVQVRNWFANKRQRSAGEEKKRVAKMAKDLSLAA
ncbi:hypothetical protein JCM9279_003129 [Rhodotorula babjevae]